MKCGTSSGVMLNFQKVEVVNRLRKDLAHETIKNYTVTYDQTWIFSKIQYAFKDSVMKSTSSAPATLSKMSSSTNSILLMKLSRNLFSRVAKNGLQASKVRLLLCSHRSESHQTHSSQLHSCQLRREGGGKDQSPHEKGRAKAQGKR